MNDRESVTIEQIRKNAPDGATHYVMFGAYGAFMYFCKIDNEIHHWDCRKWCKSKYTTSEMLKPLN